MTTSGVFGVATSANRCLIWIGSKSASNIIQYQTIEFPTGSFSSITDITTEANCESISILIRRQ